MRILVQDLFGLERGGLTPAATRSARRRPNPEDAPVISHLFMTVRGPYIASAARWPLTGEAPDERLRLPLDSMPGRWRRRSRRPGRGPRCRRCRSARDLAHARRGRRDRRTDGRERRRAGRRRRNRASRPPGALRSPGTADHRPGGIPATPETRPQLEGSHITGLGAPRELHIRLHGLTPEQIAA